MAACISGLPIPPGTGTWLNTIGEALKEKLAKAGLKPWHRLWHNLRGHPPSPVSPRPSRWPWLPTGWRRLPPSRYGIMWIPQIWHTRLPSSGFPRPHKARKVCIRTLLVFKRTVAQNPVHGWHKMRQRRFPHQVASQTSLNRKGYSITPLCGAADVVTCV